MNYSQAIEFLREHNIKKDDGTYYEFGEVRKVQSYNLDNHKGLLVELCQAISGLTFATRLKVLKNPES